MQKTGGAARRRRPAQPGGAVSRQTRRGAGMLPHARHPSRLLAGHGALGARRPYTNKSRQKPRYRKAAQSPRAEDVGAARRPAKRAAKAARRGAGAPRRGRPKECWGWVGGWVRGWVEARAGAGWHLPLVHTARRRTCVGWEPQQRLRRSSACTLLRPERRPGSVLILVSSESPEAHHKKAER